MTLAHLNDAHLGRVSDRIAAAVIDFCRRHLDATPTFVMDELRAWVTAAVGHVAPDSPGRVLRDLRRRGVVDYQVVSRESSLYEVLSVSDGTEAGS